MAATKRTACGYELKGTFLQRRMLRKRWECIIRWVRKTLTSNWSRANKMEVFDERGAKEYPGKTSQGRVRNQQAQPFLTHRIKPWSPCLKGYSCACARWRPYYEASWSASNLLSVVWTRQSWFWRILLLREFSNFRLLQWTYSRVYPPKIWIRI